MSDARDDRKVNITVSHNTASDSPHYEVEQIPLNNSIKVESATSIHESSENGDILSPKVIELTHCDLAVNHRKLLKRKKKWCSVSRRLKQEYPNEEREFIDSNISSKRLRSLEFLSSQNSSSFKGKKFCSSWLDVADFNPWLSEGTTPSKAYCKFCRKDLIAGKSELHKHAKTFKHRRKAKEYIQLASNRKDRDDEGALLIDCEREEIVVYLLDDMHMPLSKEVKNAFVEHSIVNENIMDQPLFHGKTAEFEKKAAKFLGKESAMFALTGTMANTLAVLAHFDRSNSVAVAGDRSFIYRRCQRNLTRMNEISVRALRNLSDGRIDPDSLNRLMMQYPHHHSYGRPKVVCLENPHSYMGGLALDAQYLQKIHNICDEYDLSLHMDGARLLQASFSSGLTVQTIASYCDSVVMCLNKGLDAPNGSVIAGTRTYIDRCRKLSQVFGLSSLRLECYAAAATKALFHYQNLISKANAYARTIIKGLSDLSSSSVSLSLDSTEESCTNVILLECDNLRVTPRQLVERIKTTSEIEQEDLKERISVICKPWTANSVRLVTHAALSSEEIGAVVRKLKYIIDYEFDSYMVLENLTS